MDLSSRLGGLGWIMLALGIGAGGCKRNAPAPPPPDAAPKPKQKAKEVDPEAGPPSFVVVETVEVDGKPVPHLIYRSSVDLPQPLIDRLKLDDAKNRTPLGKDQIRLIKNFETRGKVWIFALPSGEACRAKVGGVLVLTEPFANPVLAGPLSGCGGKRWATLGVTGTLPAQTRWAAMSWQARKPVDQLAAGSPVRRRQAALLKGLEGDRRLSAKVDRAKEAAVATRITGVSGVARGPSQRLEEIGISWYYPRKPKETPADGCEAEGGQHREFIARQWGIRTKDGALSVGQTRIYAASAARKDDDLHVVGGLIDDGWFTHVMLRKPDTYFFDIHAATGGRRRLQRIRLSTGDAGETYSATTPWNAAPACPHG